MVERKRDPVEVAKSLRDAAVAKNADLQNETPSNETHKNYPAGSEKKTKPPKERSLEIDFSKAETPAWVREVVAEGMAIEAEDAKSAGKLGFMARALVQATMPYKDPKTDVFTRLNGDFKLRILAGYEGGIPYGIYPRLLVSWVTTEAVKTQNPEIKLGNSLAAMLREVLDIRTSSGGKNGSNTRVSEQMKRLFGSMISAQYTGDKARGFSLRNILIAESADFSDEDLRRIDSSTTLPANSENDGNGDGDLWVPQRTEEAGAWSSTLRLTPHFFKECVEHPVPIDLRAFRVLRGAPMAMDIYTWLTYRMSYTNRASRLIRWESMQMQFGSGMAEGRRGTLNFKRDFLKNLALVMQLYPQLNVKAEEGGLILLPSSTHIPLQNGLF